jgi:hypothetical protein
LVALEAVELVRETKSAAPTSQKVSRAPSIKAIRVAMDPPTAGPAAAAAVHLQRVRMLRLLFLALAVTDEQ